MKKKGKGVLFIGLAILLAVICGLFVIVSKVNVRIEVHPQPPRFELDLVDDRIEDKKPVFDPDLVDSRPLEGWEINKSDAVIALDCPHIRPDTQGELLILRPSYADAVKAAKENDYELLPSANMLDAMGKQFDDGLYAAVDLACYRGELGTGPAAVDFVRAVFDELQQGDPARPFLAAALELADIAVELTADESAKKAKRLSSFEADKVRSKPISFYNWTPELQQVWKVFRFLQTEFEESPDASSLEIPKSLANVLESNPELLEQYRSFTGFYSRLTNPLYCLPVDALIDTKKSLKELAAYYGASSETVAFFPPSTSRETELFAELFRFGLPANVNIMGELITRIRSGEVDLAPKDVSGWYQYQVYALETLLVPSKGDENDKLLLKASYKRRLVEAFKALITKRRETHARQHKLLTEGGEASPPQEMSLRLRIEPCATFYLRTARAYAFLQDFLTATVGEDTLTNMHGMRKGGQREPNLAEELDHFRQLFYGFYLIACEDIGMRPEFIEGEPVQLDLAMKSALDCLADLSNNPDLAIDTRVSLPMFLSVIRGKTRLWGTLGVRLALLDASYAKAPRIRAKDSDDEWQVVDSYTLGTSKYVIAVDEFAEFEIKGSSALTRDEFRAICDKHKTREKIMKALSRI